MITGTIFLLTADAKSVQGEDAWDGWLKISVLI